MSKTRVSLLIGLLKSFSEKELEAFSKFVDSPYHNDDQKLIDLLKKIKRYALKAEKFSKELQLKVYEGAFCDKPLQQKELTQKQYVFLNNKQRKLLRLAEKFLIVENVSTHNNVKPEFLYNTLIDRNQHKLYQRHVKNDFKKLDEESKRGLEYYTAQYKLQEIQLYFLVKNGEISKKDNYNELQYYLTTNFIIEKLKFHLAQRTLENTYNNKEYDFSSLTEIAFFFKKPEFAKNPLIQLYLSNINLINEQSDQSFNELKETLMLNLDILPARFLKIFFTNLNNYCAAQIKKGKEIYYQKLFDIYYLMHENDLLVIDNFIDSTFLRNIINVSCVIKEFEWANHILLAYKKFVPLKIRESVYHYNKGLINFKQGDYVAAQDWFLKVDKVSDTHEIGLRIFILQCIYEIEPDYNEAIRQSFESTKQFFRRNFKLHPINKASYLNFITIFTDLYKYKHKVSKINLLKIKDKMNNMEVIHKMKWLNDKINELAKKKPRTIFK